MMNTRGILENWTPQHIANITNVVSELWDNALAKYTPNTLLPYLRTPQATKITLLMDVLPEDQLYIQTNASNELNGIQGRYRCAINLNLQANMRDLDATQVTIIGQADGVLNAYQEFRKLIPIKPSEQSLVTVRSSNTAVAPMPNVHMTGTYYPIYSPRMDISDRLKSIVDSERVEIHFDVSIFESKILENFAQQMDRISEEFGVRILMKPRFDPNHKLMILKGTDKDVIKIFDVRRHIEALLKKPQINHNNNYI